ncbi:MAG TPA: hypothetical protein VGF54_11625 [Streptosporangiaceae bacterium]|jgi:hypothetical protein
MIRAFLAAAAAGATLATSGFTGSGASVAAAPGEQLWTARYDNGGTDDASSVAASPDGTKVFVTGTSETQFDGSPQYTTVAYNATTGAQLWASRYIGAAIGTDVALSPDGTEVFVTGRTELNDHPRFATVAYNAASGAQLWAKLYGSGAGLSGAAPSSLAVSPDGSRVVVTGYNSGPSGAPSANYATVAYSAVTGARLWARTYNGPGNGRDVAAAVTISGSGRVFVTGSSYGGASRLGDYATVAYAGASGTRAWVARYNGPASGGDAATAIAFSPGQGRVTVTGSSAGVSSGQDYATVAYNTTTGVRIWASRYNGPGNGRDSASAVTVSGSGRVLVTGSSYGGAATGSDYATVAYAGASGTRAWVARYNGPGSRGDAAAAIAFTSGQVAVTGTSDGGTATGSDYATVAYNTTTGARIWASRYNGPGNPDFPGPSADTATAITITPNGATTFVTGSSSGITGSTRRDYLTLAYRS